jgi:hypothetical protein
MAGSVHNLFLAVDPRPVSGQESARLLRLIRASFAPVMVSTICRAYPRSPGD